MYEPIRTKSVHSMAAAPADFPHRTREEELDIQLAAHLAALLAATDDLRALTPGDAVLDAAADRLAAQVHRLRGGAEPLRATTGAAREGAGHPATADPAADPDRPARLAELHRRAHALAGRALVVAASRADTAAAILSAECMDVHAAGAVPGARSAPGAPEATHTAEAAEATEPAAHPMPATTAGPRGGGALPGPRP